LIAAIVVMFWVAAGIIVGTVFLIIFKGFLMISAKNMMLPPTFRGAILKLAPRNVVPLTSFLRSLIIPRGFCGAILQIAPQTVVSIIIFVRFSGAIFELAP
jgi:hypothetical protein